MRPRTTHTGETSGMFAIAVRREIALIAWIHAWTQIQSLTNRTRAYPIGNWTNMQPHAHGLPVQIQASQELLSHLPWTGSATEAQADSSYDYKRLGSCNIQTDTLDGFAGFVLKSLFAGASQVLQRQ